MDKMGFALGILCLIAACLNLYFFITGHDHVRWFNGAVVLLCFWTVGKIAVALWRE